MAERFGTFSSKTKRKLSRNRLFGQEELAGERNGKKDNDSPRRRTTMTGRAEMDTKRITTTGNPVLDRALDFNTQVVTSSGALLIKHKELTDRATRKGLTDRTCFLTLDFAALMRT